MSRIAAASENRGMILTEQVSTPQRSRGSTSLLSLVSLVEKNCYMITSHVTQRDAVARGIRPQDCDQPEVETESWSTSFDLFKSSRIWDLSTGLFPGNAHQELDLVFSSLS